MANPMTTDFDVETQESVTREMTNAEHTDYLLSITPNPNAQALADARTSGITHALSLGFTQAQAGAMFP